MEDNHSALQKRQLGRIFLPSVEKSVPFLIEFETSYEAGSGAAGKIAIIPALCADLIVSTVIWL
jgi:hypothetical protein